VTDELRTPTPAQRRERIDRLVDIISVLLLSITAVLSAICIYQSARWSGDSTRLYNRASAYRISAGIATAESNEFHLIDIGLFLRYIEAVHGGDKSAADFLFDHFRPEARPAIVAWLKSDPMHNKHAAKTPFLMPEYRLASDQAVKSYEARSAASFRDAVEANRQSESFLRLTIILSTAAFLGGMSTKFRFPFHLIVVTIGTIAVIYGIARMLSLPFQSAAL
jgi:hypothetical protein